MRAEVDGYLQVRAPIIVTKIRKDSVQLDVGGETMWLKVGDGLDMSLDLDLQSK